MGYRLGTPGTASIGSNTDAPYRREDSYYLANYSHFYNFNKWYNRFLKDCISISHFGAVLFTSLFHFHVRL